MTSSAEITGRIALEGEMTIYTAAELKARLLKALEENEALEVDLSGVSELDSAGLQLMVLLKREAGDQGKSVRFADHSQAVLDVLDLTDVGSVFGDPVLIRSQAA
ncbi:STAS domain-containing protein [Candidatus Methylospira mobilis]|uniref:STAS domain-containing protein n=1 Tax=Candidatus Methylospira mobilis TaxID=1808979 RepID=A0A5Q0BFQ4_9GAMM|nr:STAS domain-containing protein [Candidatus Methylospira mobilis]QFY42369.1 STAS domain-containing protein [Candidatus Methylospira mobilis]WNV04533.1 STAS domain-containing protein [Candidatus Methylospira mobilis]